MTDWIQQTIAARAETLGLSAYRVWQMVREANPDGTMSAETVKRYLDGRCSLKTSNAGQIADVLRLKLTPGNRSR